MEDSSQGKFAAYVSRQVALRLLWFLLLGTLFVSPSVSVFSFDLVVSTVSSTEQVPAYLSASFQRRLDFVTIFVTSIVVLTLGIIVSTRNVLIKFIQKFSFLPPNQVVLSKALFLFALTLFLLLAVANIQSFFALLYAPAFRIEPSARSLGVASGVATIILAITLSTLYGVTIFYFSLKKYLTAFAGISVAQREMLITPNPAVPGTVAKSAVANTISTQVFPRSQKLKRLGLLILGGVIIVIFITIIERSLTSSNISAPQKSVATNPDGKCSAEQTFDSLSKALRNKSEACSLRIASNDTTLSNKIGELTNLKELYISGPYSSFTGSFACHKLSTIPPAIGRLSNLQGLNIHCGPLASLPNEIGNLRQLKKLAVIQSKLISLPDTIGEMENLEVLEINHTQDQELIALPQSVGYLRNLKELSISATGLKQIPTTIGELSNLENLYLPANEIDVLPEQIGGLRNLKMLSLDSSNLTQLPPSIGQLEKLESLSVRGNKLTTLPSAIGNLKTLNRIDAGANLISSLPVEFSELSSLKSLDLFFNRLTSFPPSILALTTLEFLGIGKNQITSIPSEISQLKSLKSLRLNGNGIPLEQRQHIQELLPSTTIHY